MASWLKGRKSSTRTYPGYIAMRQQAEGNDAHLELQNLRCHSCCHHETILICRFCESSILPSSRAEILPKYGCGSKVLTIPRRELRRYRAFDERKSGLQYTVLCEGQIARAGSCQEELLRERKYQYRLWTTARNCRIPAIPHLASIPQTRD